MTKLRINIFWLAVILAVLVPAVFTSCSSTGGGYNLGPTQNVAGAVGGLTLDDGVPTGNWICSEERNRGSMKTTVKSTLNIDADGLGWMGTGYVTYWNFGTAAQRRVGWTTQTKIRKIKREGNQIFVSVDPPRFKSAHPPGGTLESHYAEAGGLLSDFRGTANTGGVRVFEISGKNLVLVNAPKRGRPIFIRGSNR